MSKRQTRIGEHFGNSSRQRRTQATQVSYAEPSPSESRPASPGDSEGSEGLATIRLTQRSSPTKQTLSQKRNKRVYALSSSDEDMDVVDEQVPVASSSTRPHIPSIPMDDDSDDEPIPNPRPRTRKHQPVIQVKSRKPVVLAPFYSIRDSPQRPKRSTRATQSPQKPNSDRSSVPGQPKGTRKRLMPVVEIPRLPPPQLALYSTAPLRSNKAVSFAEAPKKSISRVLLSVSPVLDDPMEGAAAPVTPGPEDDASSDEFILRPSASKGKARATPRTYPPIPSRTPSPIIPAESSDDEIIRRKRVVHSKPTKHSKSSHRSRSPPKQNSRTFHKHKPRHRDPDESDGAVTDEDDVDDLKLDEPERFETKSRLRTKKETDFQRRLRKLKQLREGIVDDSTDESESEAEDELASRSAPKDKDFIVEDDGEELVEGLMPHEFSINSAQTPEFKFKVVFHWLLLLVMDSQSALHLRPDDREYFMPQVEDLRRKMKGHREARVRSQIWRGPLVKALQKYPSFHVEHLGMNEIGCDVCHISTKHSPFLGHLTGDPYDPNSHEVIKEDKGSSDESSSEEETTFANQGKRRYLMGRHCQRRAEIYHRMVHWEHVLYNRIRDYYRDLLRAKNVASSFDSEASSEESDGDENDNERTERREERENRRYKTARGFKELKEMQLTKKVDWKSVDKVLLWMDRDMEYQAQQFRWLENLIDQSELLENDKSKDE